MLKRGNATPAETDNLIAHFLPLASLENIKELEAMLKSSEEAVTQFVSTKCLNLYLYNKFWIQSNGYVSCYLCLQKGMLTKIGGNNPRDNVHRFLKKTFTNACALLCSWKGIRNNFRLSDLYLIKIMKGTLQLT